MLNPRGRSQAYNAMWVEEINNFHIVVVAATAAVSKVGNLKFCVEASHLCGFHNECRFFLLEKETAKHRPINCRDMWLVANIIRVLGRISCDFSLARILLICSCVEKKRKKRRKVSKYNSFQIMLYICFISPHTAPWTRLCGKAFKAFLARVNGRFVAASKGGK